MGWMGGIDDGKWYVRCLVGVLVFQVCEACLHARKIGKLGARRECLPIPCSSWTVIEHKHRSMRAIGIQHQYSIPYIPKWFLRV
jgi:hypothetical protein